MNNTYEDKLRQYMEKGVNVIIDLDGNNFTGGMIIDFGKDFIELKVNKARFLIDRADVITVSYKPIEKKYVDPTLNPAVAKKGTDEMLFEAVG